MLRPRVMTSTDCGRQPRARRLARRLRPRDKPSAVRPRRPMLGKSAQLTSVDHFLAPWSKQPTGTACSRNRSLGRSDGFISRYAAGFAEVVDIV